jgi:hypothetical protein
MIERLPVEKEERAHPYRVAHLSHSQVSRYLLWPEQYRLYYIENLRPRLFRKPRLWPGVRANFKEQ